MKHVVKETKSAFKGFIVETLKVVHIFLVLVAFTAVLLFAAKGITPLHPDVDQRASDYAQLQ